MATLGLTSPRYCGDAFGWTKTDILPLTFFDNLKMSSKFIERVNGRSDYMVLTDLGSATAAPNNRPAVGSTFRVLLPERTPSGTWRRVDQSASEALPTTP